MNKLINKVAEVRVRYRPRISDNPVIRSSKDSYEILKHFFQVDTIQMKEEFLVMYLNNANRVLGVYPAFTGGIRSTIVDVRLILSVALATLSTSIILAHNHPSGNLKPSQNDIDLTERIKQAGKLMDVKVLDHLIITENNMYYSFAEEGEM